ncbi:MAG: hypothetical protein ACJA06_002106 [Halocynthiibacter sp.]|jgi:hypothetical protein
MEQPDRNSDDGPVRLQVFLDEKGVLRLWSVRLDFQRAVHEVSFPECNRVSNALVPALATHLRRVADLLRSGGRLDRPGPMVELDGGLLSELSARARFGTSGFVEIEINYQHFFGTLSCLFNRPSSARDATIRAREKIAVEALVDIAGPLLGIAQQAGKAATADSEDFRDQLAEIGARADELEASLQMMRSYLAALDAGAQRAAPQPVAPLRRSVSGADSGHPDGTPEPHNATRNPIPQLSAHIVEFPKADPAKS